MSETPFAPFRIKTDGLAERPIFPDTPTARTSAATGGLRHTAALARTLAATGRAIDLTGLDSQVGLLCAGALDLAAEEGRILRVELEGLRDEIDALAVVMRLPLPPN